IAAVIDREVDCERRQTFLSVQRHLEGCSVDALDVDGLDYGNRALGVERDRNGIGSGHKLEVIHEEAPVEIQDRLPAIDGDRRVERSLDGATNRCVVVTDHSTLDPGVDLYGGCCDD